MIPSCQGVYLVYDERIHDFRLRLKLGSKFRLQISLFMYWLPGLKLFSVSAGRFQSLMSL
jgi:hypothetical protein